ESPDAFVKRCRALEKLGIHHCSLSRIAGTGELLIPRLDLQLRSTVCFTRLSSGPDVSDCPDSLATGVSKCLFGAVRWTRDCRTARHRAMTTLLTVGHGTLSAETFASLLHGAGVGRLVDVRSFPGSRRNPQFGREEMERWVPAAAVGYIWLGELGGR